MQPASRKTRRRCRRREGKRRRLKVFYSWSEVKTQWSEHVAKVHKKRDQAKADFDAKHAERQAEVAERDAEDAVDFAYSAVQEAESAVLDAIQARAAADDPETAQSLATAKPRATDAAVRLDPVS